ncbi:hypothetical protein [Pseudovibrio sp. Tun.PSC04-5.I4]|uniref:hypothetical protein n=1 Tax=Pseudovibrio sp. Tun.PSC04-5.I4 TaxID=1798213 RepID=UPI00087F73D5|nr:hypothetical protein [Pseudovibrio sp. Tun.PSC04-5.I4]SDQ23418.1 hypothetical protein SAMN04515695_0598 [Pseudovibrio sp. Tun.PSC04-5.I4]
MSLSEGVVILAFVNLAVATIVWMLLHSSLMSKLHEDWKTSGRSIFLYPVLYAKLYGQFLLGGRHRDLRKWIGITALWGLFSFMFLGILSLRALGECYYNPDYAIARQIEAFRAQFSDKKCVDISKNSTTQSNSPQL